MHLHSGACNCLLEAAELLLLFVLLTALLVRLVAAALLSPLVSLRG
jgi:hypothetical protein